MSIFRRKSSAKLGGGGGASPPVPPESNYSRRASAPVVDTEAPRLFVDDWGQPVEENRPAFVREVTGVYGIGNEDDGPIELALEYGWANIETAVELPIERVYRLVNEAAREIRSRGLDTPRILSSMALDISLESTCTLIRSYLADPALWLEDLSLAEPLNVASFMKWGLARLVNERGQRGFVSFDLYSQFKTAERISSYASQCVVTHLLDQLPASNSRLLVTLLDLFSSIAAHSKTNGMPPRRLAGLFAPYLFGLPDDETFDATYEAWQRAASATEHILLAYIRSREASGPLPTHLARHIIGYPDFLGLDYNINASPKVPPTARVEEVTRVRRLTRFHSRNLIASAGAWDVPQSHDWKLLFPAGTVPGTPKPGEPPATVYTARYRHLLNIRSGAFIDEDDDDRDFTRYKSMVDKEWAKFGELGFKDVEPNKLQFDLSEGERERFKAKRDTMDWGTFANSGFSGNNSFSSSDLIFHQSIGQQVKTWPVSQQQLNQRLKQAEKMLPSFPYDTTPREEGHVQVDAHFFEAWADVLVSGGWARDELKESSFALIQWKSRPRIGEKSAGGVDERTEDRWFLVEEFVPREYRDQLTDQKHKQKASKRISFMRVVRRKDESSQLPSAKQIRHPHLSGQGASVLLAPLSSTSSRPMQSNQLRPIDETVFAEDSPHETRLLSLSSEHLATPSQNGAGTSAYAPSFVSTTGAKHGHSTAELARVDTVPEPLPPQSAVSSSPARRSSLAHTSATSQEQPAALAHQQPSPTQPQQQQSRQLPPPVGYTKPQPRGFLARISSRRQKNKQQPAAVKATSSPRLGFGTGLFDRPPKTPEKDHFVPGAPNLAPVVERAPPASGHSPATQSEEDPYGGISDDPGTNVGQAMFSGSDDDELSADDAGGHGSVPNTPRITVEGSPRTANIKRVPVPTLDGAAAGGHDSLPPSPKPDADSPTDVASDTRYLSGVSTSGASDYSSRVRNIVGLYEARDSTGSGSASAAASSPATDADGVRLTQYGFGEEGGVQQQQH